MPPENKDKAPDASTPGSTPPVDKAGIDLGKILLPKKEGAPSPQSAQRVNAGALLEQANAPAAPAPTPAPVPTPVPTPTAAAAPQPPKKEEPGIAPLQTYKGDIEKVVEGGASVISMAAAEAKRQDTQKTEAANAPKPPRDTKGLMKRVGLIAGGVLLVAIALGAVALFALRPTTVPVVQGPAAPFIAVDETRLVLLPADATRASAMPLLQTARQSAALPLGLVEWMYVAVPAAPTPQQTVVTPRQLTARELLMLLGSSIPESFLRSLSGAYLLGVHSYDENQPFLILQVDSYQSAYAGMLDWERTMQADLSPLFVRTPSPQQGPATATTTASSTPATATTTPQSTTDFINTGFADRVVENLDARVIHNAAGDILLLWTFLGRNTVVVTTNEATLREVVSRMQSAPVVPIP